MVVHLMMFQLNHLMTPCTFVSGIGDGGVVIDANLSDPSDPVNMGSVAHLGGGVALYYDNADWMYSSEQSRGVKWQACPFVQETNADRLRDGNHDQITAINVFDPISRTPLNWMPTYLIL